MYTVFVITFTQPLSVVAVSVTLCVPSDKIVYCGFCSVEKVAPASSTQLHCVTAPDPTVDRSLNSMGSPAHTRFDAEKFAAGFGLIVITKGTGSAGQPLRLAETLTVPLCAVEPVFVVVKEGNGLPLPLPARPIAVFEFCQVNEGLPPPGSTLKLMAAEFSLGQNSVFMIGLMTGVG